MTSLLLAVLEYASATNSAGFSTAYFTAHDLVIRLYMAEIYIVTVKEQARNSDIIVIKWVLITFKKTEI